MEWCRLPENNSGFAQRLLNAPGGHVSGIGPIQAGSWLSQKPPQIEGFVKVSWTKPTRRQKSFACLRFCRHVIARVSRIDPKIMLRPE
jgi:hypothetical protein